MTGPTTITVSRAGETLVTITGTQLVPSVSEGGPDNTDQLPEGTTNKYATAARIRAQLVAAFLADPASAFGLTQSGSGDTLAVTISDIGAAGTVRVKTLDLIQDVIDANPGKRIVVECGREVYDNLSRHPTVTTKTRNPPITLPKNTELVIIGEICALNPHASLSALSGKCRIDVDRANFMGGYLNDPLTTGTSSITGLARTAETPFTRPYGRQGVNFLQLPAVAAFASVFVRGNNTATPTALVSAGATSFSFTSANYTATPSNGNRTSLINGFVIGQKLQIILDNGAPFNPTITAVSAPAAPVIPSVTFDTPVPTLRSIPLDTPVYPFSVFDRTLTDKFSIGPQEYSFVPDITGSNNQPGFILYDADQSVRRTRAVAALNNSGGGGYAAATVANPLGTAAAADGFAGDPMLLIKFTTNGWDVDANDIPCRARFANGGGWVEKTTYGAGPYDRTYTGGQAKKSQGEILFVGNAAIGDQQILDGLAYTFVSAITGGSAARDVLWDPDWVVQRLNMKAAVNLSNGAGTLYASATTLHPTLEAREYVDNTLVFTSKTVAAGNDAIVLSTTGSAMKVVNHATTPLSLASSATLTGYNSESLWVSRWNAHLALLRTAYPDRVWPGDLPDNPATRLRDRWVIQAPWSPISGTTGDIGSNAVIVITGDGPIVSDVKFENFTTGIRTIPPTDLAQISDLTIGNVTGRYCDFPMIIPGLAASCKFGSVIMRHLSKFQNGAEHGVYGSGSFEKGSISAGPKIDYFWVYRGGQGAGMQLKTCNDFQIGTLIAERCIAGFTAGNKSKGQINNFITIDHGNEYLLPGLVNINSVERDFSQSLGSDLICNGSTVRVGWGRVQHKKDSLSFRHSQFGVVDGNSDNIADDESTETGGSVTFGRLDIEMDRRVAGRVIYGKLFKVFVGELNFVDYGNTNSTILNLVGSGSPSSDNCDIGLGNISGTNRFGLFDGTASNNVIRVDPNRLGTAIDPVESCKSISGSATGNVLRLPSSVQLSDIDTRVASAFEARKWKDPVDVATTANINLTGEQVIDGFTTSNSSVLVKNHSNPTKLGPYISAAGAWTRAPDANTAAELSKGSFFVRNGTVNKGRTFTANTIATLETDAITFDLTSLGNPTKADVGLSNVDNTSDANKPVSTAQAAAIAAASSALVTTTWASRGTGAAAGERKQITDVGPERWIAVWNATLNEWKPEGGKALIARGSVALPLLGSTSASEQIAVTIAPSVLQAGLPGTTGGYEIQTLYGCNASANAKSISIRFGASGSGIGGSQFCNVSSNSTSQSFITRTVIRNRGAANSQVGTTAGAQGGYGRSDNARTTSGINTANAHEINLDAIVANAADTVTLEEYEVWLLA